MQNFFYKILMYIAAKNRSKIAPLQEKHPFLHGIHQPIEKELTFEELEWSGSIPPELDGLYVRNGPNPIGSPEESTYHWFLGDGMVHGLKLKNGRPQWYKNRWVRSTSVSRKLGEEPVPGPRNSLVDTVNTNVIGFAGKLWALVEAGGYPVELDGDLNTVAHNPFNGTLKGSFTAHPHRDPASGSLHGICYSGHKRNLVTHVTVAEDGAVVKEIDIPVKDGPSIHDCAITENYVLIFDLPVTFSKNKFLSGYLFPYEWNPNHEARIGLLDRRSRTPAKPSWHSVDPCYVFHPCNAYETEAGEIIVDVCSHDSMFASSTFGPDSKSIKFERWTLNASKAKFSKRTLDNSPQEFPRFDERLTGKYYRYAYAVSLNLSSNTDQSDSAIIKHDLKSGRKQTHNFGAGRIPGEFVFVPKNFKSQEDEGWLLGLVINVARGETDFSILDAQNIEGPPVAEIKISHLIPPGFHGNWVFSSELGDR